MKIAKRNQKALSSAKKPSNRASEVMERELCNAKRNYSCGISNLSTFKVLI